MTPGKRFPPRIDVSRPRGKRFFPGLSAKATLPREAPNRNKTATKTAPHSNDNKLTQHNTTVFSLVSVVVYLWVSNRYVSDRLSRYPGEETFPPSVQTSESGETFLPHPPKSELFPNVEIDDERLLLPFPVV